MSMSELDFSQIIKRVYDSVTDALRITGSISLTINAEKVDDAAFTAGTSYVSVIGAFFDNTGTDSVDENDVGAVRMSANRNLFMNIRDSAGNERGVNVTAGSALTVDGSATTQPVSAASLPLPTGASTLAEQQTQTTALQLIDDTVAITGAAITSKGLAISGTDGTNARVLKTDSSGELQVDVLFSALPSGASTEAKQPSLGTAGTASSNVITIQGIASMTAIQIADNGGSITVDGTVTSTNNYDVVDFIDTTPVLDTASTNIPASASNPVEIVSTLAANVKKIKINETTGAFVGIYTGVALSEVLQCVSGPGEDGTIEVQMTSGQRVSLRNMANSTISTGSICIQFIG